MDVMDLKTFELNPKSWSWWLEINEVYEDDYSEVIYSTSFIGGDFEDWCMIPYSEWEKIVFHDDAKYEFKLYLGSVKGVVKEYTLKLKGKDEKNYAVYFDMEEV